MVSTHLVHYNGKTIETTVTDKASVTDKWVLNIQSINKNKGTVAGLNCKWKPHPIPSMSSKISLLQLCVDTQCLILQLHRIDQIPNSLRDFLSDPNNLFVGIEILEIGLRLKNEYGLECCNKSDIRLLAKILFPLSFHGKPGLKTMAHQFVKLPIWKPKQIRLNELGERNMDKMLIKFSCVDAYACYRIGEKLLGDFGVHI